MNKWVKWRWIKRGFHLQSFRNKFCFSTLHPITISQILFSSIFLFFTAAAEKNMIGSLCLSLCLSFCDYYYENNVCGSKNKRRINTNDIFIRTYIGVQRVTSSSSSYQHHHNHHHHLSYWNGISIWIV